MKRYLPLTILAFLFCGSIQGQQVPDTGFTYPIPHPAYQKESGPVIFIDEAHLNMHTRNGGFLPFTRLLEHDGYTVKSLSERLTSKQSLTNCKILVIVNAIHPSNEEEWALPALSAFTPEEIETVKQWVFQGGRLFLIADHMPFAGAAYEMGKAFGFDFLNGFAYTRQRSWPPSLFKRSDNTLLESPVTAGMSKQEKIDSVASFTGSAFQAPENSIPVLRFIEGNYSLQPDTAWQFSADTPKQDLAGYCQGAILNYGKGKVAVFGEAAMFTAQIANGTLKAGFNSEVAPQNAQFALNLVHWLDKD
ncbi:DUF4350 domain-containing protein [Bacteroidota bacterium]